MSHSNKEGFNEENIPAQQSPKEEDPWILGEDEYQERSKCFKAEAIEGEEEVDRLNPECLRTGRESIQQTDDEDRRERILQVYKKGADQAASGLQKGDQRWEEDSLSELYPFYSEE